MKTFNPLTNRYRPLKTSCSDTSVLVIDTDASHGDLLDAAQQRLRAASDLLETLYCLCFKQADVKDIPNIVNALYLLTQDGCELLEVAKQQIHPI
ncbi:MULTISPECIES: hypothetical protein [Pseudomonas]|jgi:hypothetical protein|uniref:Uncharacterized protein n=2 Tax=Pseudomonas TaxID=286 RepID=A0ACC5MM37_9PSED|nr:MULTISPECIES: hypothetical protein [Pseudomonas]ATE80231.1 hypothetical protein CNN82_28910 [Pseudomonas frederiksbergensis]MBB2889635.1 hypothetical protein [Pseudomonas umsongensis]NMN76531.1 hypothetical protein [Pseudomonas sp. KD5]CAH0235911.1 hypothetical protein SRABI123_02767 [Pseudomonas sp. Bi123]GID04168.1 hypothetical protein TMM008_13700 [Pseudomonas sp. 008]